MAKLCHRLERRKNLKLRDYYALGKLIHYIVDAFTSAHNDHFPWNLQGHRSYEKQLHIYFTAYLQRHRQPAAISFLCAMDAIQKYHKEYAQKPMHIHTDSQYSLLVSNIVICMLCPSFASVS